MAGRGIGCSTARLTRSRIGIMQQALQLSGIAVALIAIGVSMAFYEWSRIKAGRPIWNGSDAIQMYWAIYLGMFVLGATFFLAAIIR